MNLTPLNCTLKNGDGGKLYVMYILPHFLKRATIKKEEGKKPFWLLWEIRNGAVSTSQTGGETGERVRSGRLGECSGSGADRRPAGGAVTASFWPHLCGVHCTHSPEARVPTCLQVLQPLPSKAHRLWSSPGSPHARNPERGLTPLLPSTNWRCWVEAISAASDPSTHLPLQGAAVIPAFKFN